MRRLLDVWRSEVSEWLRHPLSDQALEDQRLLDLILAAYTVSHGSMLPRTSFSICER